MASPLRPIGSRLSHGRIARNHYASLDAAHSLVLRRTNGPTACLSALRRSVPGISSRVLTERLRALEAKGFLYRDYKPTIPPEVTYGLDAELNDRG